MDRAYFEQLAMPLFDQLYNHACWLTGSRADGEDLVQETFAKALRGFASFDEGTNLRAWMFRILRNSFLNSRTGLAALKTGYLEDEASGGEQAASDDVTPEVRLLEREAQEVIYAALESLPVAQREMILMSDVEEMSYREIAQVLDVPLGTVMSRLSRARRSLRVRLGESMKEGVK